MQHKEILETAIKLMNGDRAEKHGGIESENFKATALMWSAYLRKKGLQAALSTKDVMMLMTLFKIGRTQHGELNEDDYIDGAAYLAMGGEFELDYADVKSA